MCPAECGFERLSLLFALLGSPKMSENLMERLSFRYETDIGFNLSRKHRNCDLERWQPATTNAISFRSYLRDCQWNVIRSAASSLSCQQMFMLGLAIPILKYEYVMAAKAIRVSGDFCALKQWRWAHSTGALGHTRHKRDVLRRTKQC